MTCQTDTSGLRLRVRERLRHAVPYIMDRQARFAGQSALQCRCSSSKYAPRAVPVVASLLLQTGAEASWFFCGNPVPSSALMAPMSRCFVADLEALAAESGGIVRFVRGERKDKTTRAASVTGGAARGCCYVGKAHERAQPLRTERRRRPNSETCPWLVRMDPRRGRVGVSRHSPAEYAINQIHGAEDEQEVHRENEPLVVDHCLLLVLCPNLIPQIRYCLGGR